LEQLGAIGTGGTENQTPIDPASAYVTNIVSGAYLEAVDVLLKRLLPCFSSLITICRMRHRFPLDSHFAKCEDFPDADRQPEGD
jgi:hypothetical protein